MERTKSVLTDFIYQAHFAARNYESPWNFREDFFYVW